MCHRLVSEYRNIGKKPQRFLFLYFQCFSLLLLYSHKFTFTFTFTIFINLLLLFYFYFILFILIITLYKQSPFVICFSHTASVSYFSSSAINLIAAIAFNCTNWINVSKTMFSNRVFLFVWLGMRKVIIPKFAFNTLSNKNAVNVLFQLWLFSRSPIGPLRAFKIKETI